MSPAAPPPRAYSIKTPGSLDGVPFEVMAQLESRLLELVGRHEAHPASNASALLPESLEHIDLGGWRFVYRLNVKEKVIEVLAGQRLSSS